MPVTPEQIAKVQLLLPEEAATEYGWTEEFIENLMDTNGFSPARAVRYFWLQRVNESAEYIDANGKSLTKIHAQARAMLQYWDEILAAGGDGTDAPPSNTRQPISFGEIERPQGYVRAR